MEVFYREREMKNPRGSDSGPIQKTSTPAGGRLSTKSMPKISRLDSIVGLKEMRGSENRAQNNRFNPTNPLTRGLLEDSCNPRAKPFGHGFAG